MATNRAGVEIKPTFRTLPGDAERMTSGISERTEQKINELIGERLQEAEQYIEKDPTGKYDGNWKPEGRENEFLPAITFWQRKVVRDSGKSKGKTVDNPRPVRVKFSIKRFNSIDVVEGCFDIKFNVVFSYPLTKKEYESYRQSEKEELEKQAQDVLYKRPQYLPSWLPDIRAENFIEGETNEDDSDKIDYRVIDPWDPKKKGVYHHPETAQPWLTDTPHLNDAASPKHKRTKSGNEQMVEQQKADENNMLGKVQWHEPEGCYPHVSFRKDWAGTFSELMEVDNFPFDCQDMSVLLKDQNTSDQCYYMPQNLGKCKHKWDEKTKRWSHGKHEPPINFGKIQKNTSSIVGWEFARGIMEFTHTNPQDSTKLAKYPRMILRFKFARMWSNILVSLALPLMITWILTCFTWMLDPLTYDRGDGAEWGIPGSEQGGAGGDRLGYLSGLLLTVVAFIPAIQEKLPEVPYRTWIDEYLLTCLIFMVIAILLQVFNAPGLTLIEHRGVWAHIGTAAAYTFIPNNTDCCVRIPAFIRSLPKEVQSHNKWGDGDNAVTWMNSIQYDDDQIAADWGKADAYCSGLFLGYNANRPETDWEGTVRPETWTEAYWTKQMSDHTAKCTLDKNGAAQTYTATGALIAPTTECTTSRDAYAKLLSDRIKEQNAMDVPYCYGHSGFLKWLDNIFFILFMIGTIVCQLYFLAYAFYARRKEKLKLTADTVMLSEQLDEEDDSNMLYGHMSQEAQRWYPGGISTINHGEELEVYLITSSYTTALTDAGGNVLKKRGTIKLDEMTQNFPRLSEETLAKVRASGQKDYQNIEDGVIIHEGASDMGARGGFSMLQDHGDEIDEIEEHLGIDIDGDGMVGDGIPGADDDGDKQYQSAAEAHQEHSRTIEMSDHQ